MFYERAPFVTHSRRGSSVCFNHVNSAPGTCRQLLARFAMCGYWLLFLRKADFLKSRCFSMFTLDFVSVIHNSNLFFVPRCFPNNIHLIQDKWPLGLKGDKSLGPQKKFFFLTYLNVRMLSKANLFDSRVYKTVTILKESPSLCWPTRRKKFKFES